MKVLLFLLKLSFSPGRTGGFQLLRNNQAQAQQSYAAPELLILFLFLLSGYRQHCRAGEECYRGDRYRRAGLRGQRSFSAAV